MNGAFTDIKLSKALKLAGVPQISSAYFHHKSKETFYSKDIYTGAKDFSEHYTAVFNDAELNGFLPPLTASPGKLYYFFVEIRSVKLSQKKREEFIWVAGYRMTADDKIGFVSATGPDEVTAKAYLLLALIKGNQIKF